VKRRDRSQAKKGVEFGGREGEGLEELQSLLEPGRHQETAMCRQLAYEELEDRGLGQAVLEISGQHVQLIKIRQQCTVGFPHIRPRSYLRLPSLFLDGPATGEG